MCNEHFVFQGEKREQHTQINVSAIQMIFRYTPRKARLCRAARPDHTKGTSGMVYDMFSYRNLYNVSHWNSLQTRVYRVQLIAFLFSKIWLQTQSRETRHFTQQYAGQCNISPWYMCLTVIRGQVVSVPSTPEFFFWLNVRLGGTGLFNIERRRKNIWSYVDRMLKQSTTGVLLITWINGLNNRLLER